MALPFVYREEPVALAISWVVWGFPWGSFGQLNSMWPIPGIWRQKMSRWWFVYHVIWWLLHLWIYFKKLLLCPSPYSLSLYSLPIFLPIFNYQVNKFYDSPLFNFPVLLSLPFITLFSISSSSGDLSLLPFPCSIPNLAVYMDCSWFIEDITTTIHV